MQKAIPLLPANKNRDLRSLIAISFTFLIVLSSSSKVWTYLAFKINQDYIAAELCENRFEPLTLCSGKCYLGDQLQQLDERQQDPIQGQPIKVYDLINPPVTVSLISRPTTPEKVRFANIPRAKGNTYLHAIFKPPQRAQLS